MAAGTSESLCPLLFFSLFVFTSVELSRITVTHGEDAILECYGPRDANIIMLQWKKPDLESHHYVLYFRQNRFHDDYQHELFKGRVTLKDPQWKKNGNFSVILKNVTMNDTGTYECHAGYNRSDVKFLSRVNLTVVDPPGPPGGHTEDGSVGLKVGLSVSAVLLVAGAAVGFVIYRKHKEPQSQDSYQPPAELY